MWTILASILLAVGISSAAPSHRPLPVFIQELPPPAYKVWAQWQNRQAIRRAQLATTEPSTYTVEKTVISSNRHLSGARRSSSYRGDRSRNAASDHVANMYGGTSIMTYPYIYHNPNYVPNTVTQYNPYVKVVGGVGDPEWDKIFVPCKEGTRTMEECLDALPGPIDPEEAFTILMRPFFNGHVPNPTK